ncbi:unnamed protein product [Schistosoma curassoni]|uniref:PPM-type phosphatase domain-containing protein n=1 Tax=Schistosoma curassoni TaxID=6186 RepID=A0A183KBW5_9TREM|nr:unnamed protein product [Schistosoma curassoni]
MLLYSGHKEENALNTHRFALMLSKESRKALIGCESHGSRIIKASFREKKEGITMNVIECYASTNDNNEDDKNHLYGNATTNQNKVPMKGPDHPNDRSKR